ncbi:MAG: YdcF family protein [Bacillota bacterium]
MRILLSPLFVLLVVLIPGLIYTYSRAGTSIYKSSKRLNRIIMLMLIFSLLVAILSLPFVSSRLAYLIERDYFDFPEKAIKDVDVITVLSGGDMEAPGVKYDLVGYTTSLRVMRGVKTFKESDAGLLVMQGWPDDREYKQMTGLMRELAVEMGISGEQIKEESYSRNTFQHPLKLKEKTGIDADSSVAVVTSAWHLKRAEIEYSLYFSEVVPVPADFYTFTEKGGIRDFLPQLEALQISTAVIQEYIGIIWYKVRHFSSSFI